MDWNQTLKVRYTEGFDDKNLFICQPPSKYFDLEENQLLKFLLNRILSLKKNFVDLFGLSEFDVEKIDSRDW